MNEPVGGAVAATRSPALASRAIVVTTDPAALFVPGVGVVVDPDHADELGAFIEDALSLDDVLAAQDGE